MPPRSSSFSGFSAFGRVLGLLLLLLVAGPPARAQWTAVPSLTSSPPKSQFASHELYFSDSDYEVPYYLKHFAQVANSVVETTFTSNSVTYPRGFLNIKVNRNVADNMPYNARIQEMQVALAYFYTADRPWNVYRGNTAVKVRLEAMLARWVEMQHPSTGLFAEYSATNWSLAPTGFGAMAAAQALDLIQDSGLPFDATVFNNAKVALRKALMALFTRSDMQDAASQYSNQFNGAYHAALLYLENWPDAELDAAFVAAVQNASTTDQSATGYFYEANGPDFGYSGVHERNSRIALTRMRSRTNDLMPVANLDEARWSQWLAHNLLLQPGIASPTFVINAGINTRTSTAWQGAESRPLSEFTPLSRAFSYTDTEFTNAVRAKTDSLASTPTYGSLATNNAYSYQPVFVFEALQRTETWHPTAAERTAAINTLPYLSSTRFNRILHDTRLPLSVAAVRRPSYYALFNHGNVTVANQVKLGLGSLWNPSFGTALQAVSGSTGTTATTWGTVRSGATNAYEQRTNSTSLSPTMRVNGNTVTPSAGTNNLADGVITATYNLVDTATNGSKVVTFDEDRISVSVTHTNTTNRVFLERLPLVAPTGAVLTTNASRLTLTHTNGSRLIMQLGTNSAASFSVAAASTDNLPTGLQRRAVTITATNTLSYELQVTSEYFQAGPLAAPTSEGFSPANGGADVGETVTYSLPLVNLLGAATGANFNATLQASGGVTPVTTNRTYGVIAGGATGTQPFTFTANGNFGDPLTITLALRDGTTNYGTVSYDTFIGGVAATNTTTNWQNFDGVTAPALPAGWVSSVPTGTGSGWITATNNPQTAPNAVVATPTSVVSEQRLESPAFTVPATAVNPELRFQHRWNTEASYDGGVLEISVDNGTFQDVLTAGGAFLAGGYSGTLSASYSNPLGGRAAWNGSNDTAYTQTRIALPVTMRGKALKLRFRLGSDDSVIPSGSVWRIDTIQLIYLPANNIQPAAITSAAPAGTVTVNLPYTHTFAAVGQPAPGFAVTSGTLPPGLTLSPGGLLSGTATNSFTTRTITVTASNGVTPVSPNAAQTFTLSAAVPLSVATASLPGGTTGAAYSTSLAAAGGQGPYGWTITAGSLPSGLTLAGDTVAGTPLAAGASNFTVTVTDNLGATATRNLSIAVANPASLSVVTPSLPAGVVGAAYTQTLAAVSGTAPYAWAVTSGSLPAGLTLSSGGVLSGTPTSGGSSTFTARVTDAASGAATRTFTVVISGVLDITTGALPDARTGVSYAQTLAVSGGTGPYVWSVLSGSLPPGLVLGEATGTISGTPGTLGSFAFTAKVTDANNAAATRTYTINAGNTLTWDSDPVTGGIQSGNGTWTPGGTTNWSFSGTNVAWVNGSDAVFGGGTVTLAAPVTAGALTFNTGAANLAGSNTLTLKAGAVITPNVDSTISAPLAGTSFTKAGAARLILSSAGYSGDVTISSGELRLNEPPGQRTWNGAISGAGTLLTLGSGTVTLGGSNTFSGTTTLTGQSVLRLAHGSALGLTNGNTRLNGDSNNAPSIQLTGGITVAESFNLVMWTPSTINTNTNHAQIRNISGTNELIGFLGMDAGGGRWDIAAQDGHLKVSGAVANVAARTATNADTWRTLYLGGPSSGEFTGPMTDATNGFSKLNLTVLSGTWTLGGSNKSYTGATILSNGVLNVAVALASEVRAFGGVLAGAGNTSSNLIISNGATVLRRLTNWSSPGAAFTAAQVVGTNAPAWTVRLDAAGTTNFSETPLTLPVIMASNGVAGIPPASISVQTTNFPGQGTWSAQTNASGVSIVYAPVPLVIDTATLPDGNAGQLYGVSFQASGGVVPRTWAVTAGVLPPGLQLSTEGVLSGTPTGSGYFAFDVTVTDSAGITATRAYVLHIISPLSIATTSIPPATAGLGYTQTLQTSGGVGPYAWSLAAGALPAGFSFGTDGVLSGIAPADGSHTFTVAVQDGEAVMAQQQLTLVTLPTPGSYSAWAQGVEWAKAEDSASSADPDGDGHSNFVEWAFGTDPLAGESSPAVAGTDLVGGQREVSLTFRRAPSAIRAVFTVEARDHLAGVSGWTALAVGQLGEPLESLAGNVTVSETALPSGAIEVVVREICPPGTGGRFLRISLSEQTP
jgi:autotransporter-associated beta strand protein